MTSLTREERIARVENEMRSFPDFPQPGILFSDLKFHELPTDNTDFFLKYVVNISAHYHARSDDTLFWHCIGFIGQLSQETRVCIAGSSVVVVYRDIFPLLKKPEIFADSIDLLVEHVQDSVGAVDVIIGLDARGFIFGPMMAQRMGLPFAPIRKAGKLPGKTFQASFTYEYGSDKFEAQQDAVSEGQRVVIVDDLLATGGTMSAACSLMRQMSAVVAECVVLIELVDLKGRDKISDTIYSLIKY